MLVAACVVGIVGAVDSGIGVLCWVRVVAAKVGAGTVVGGGVTGASVTGGST